MSTGWGPVAQAQHPPPHQAQDTTIATFRRSYRATSTSVTPTPEPRSLPFLPETPPPSFWDFRTGNPHVWGVLEGSGEGRHMGIQGPQDFRSASTHRGVTPTPQEVKTGSISGQEKVKIGSKLGRGQKGLEVGGHPGGSGSAAPLKVATLPRASPKFKECSCGHLSLCSAKSPISLHRCTKSCAQTVCVFFACVFIIFVCFELNAYPGGQVLKIS